MKIVWNTRWIWMSDRLGEISFKHQEFLSHLTITGIKLRRLSDWMFSQLPNLTWLDVRYGLIQSVALWYYCLYRDNHLTSIPASITKSPKWLVLIIFNLDYFNFPDWRPCCWIRICSMNFRVFLDSLRIYKTSHFETTLSIVLPRKLLISDGRELNYILNN